MSELKPCPFCGCEYDKDEEDYYYSGEHEKWCPLGNQGNIYKSNFLVGNNECDIEAWNTRSYYANHEYQARNSHCVHFEFCTRYQPDVECICPEFKMLDEETNRDELLNIAYQLDDFAEDALKCKKRIHPIIVMMAAKAIKRGLGV